jgi:hypothetical protein
MLGAQRSAMNAIDGVYDDTGIAVPRSKPRSPLAILPALAPALLVVVALAQMYTSHTRHLTPWKGGGFGMFSTVDSTSARFFRLYLVTESKAKARCDVLELPVKIPVSSNRHRSALEAIRAMPTEAAVQKLAEKLAVLPWAYYSADGDGGQWPEVNGDDPAATRRVASRIAVPKDAREKGEKGTRVPVKALRLELWRYRFDGSRAELHSQKMFESTVEVDQARR